MINRDLSSSPEPSNEKRVRFKENEKLTLVEEITEGNKNDACNTNQKEEPKVDESSILTEARLTIRIDEQLSKPTKEPPRELPAPPSLPTRAKPQQLLVQNWANKPTNDSFYLDGLFPKSCHSQRIQGGYLDIIDRALEIAEAPAIN